MVTERTRSREKQDAESARWRSPVRTAGSNAASSEGGGPYISLGEAARLAPGQPTSSAIWRWCRKGLKARDGTAVFLKHVRVGRQVYTTAGWLHEFFEAVATADQKHFMSRASLGTAAAEAASLGPCTPSTSGDASDRVPTHLDELEAALREEGL